MLTKSVQKRKKKKHVQQKRNCPATISSLLLDVFLIYKTSRYRNYFWKIITNKIQSHRRYNIHLLVFVFVSVWVYSVFFCFFLQTTKACWYGLEKSWWGRLRVTFWSSNLVNIYLKSSQLVWWKGGNSMRGIVAKSTFCLPE